MKRTQTLWLRLTAFLLLIPFLLSTGCGFPQPPPVGVTSVPASSPPTPSVQSTPTPEPPVLKGFTLRGKNDLDFTLRAEESHRLVPVFDPEDWTGEVTFTSSRPEIAAVDETGLVTNVNASDTLQRAVITVSAGGHSVNCTVYCRGVPSTAAPGTTPSPETTSPPQVIPSPDPYGIIAPRAGLYRADDLTPIHEKESGQRMAPGSMSKIVTAITALRYLSPDEVLTVGTEIGLAQPGASTSFIGKGHRLTLRQLLMGMLLPSGCDASFTVAVSTARAVSGDADMPDQEAVDYFAGLMNQLAAELGAADSHFANPDGWDHPDHYTTVRDMAILAAYAIKDPVIREIVAIREQYVVFVSGQNITWRNTNALLHPESEFYRPDAVGLKTGTTANAGNCLLSVFDREGTLYIIVVAGSPTKSGRYTDTLVLAEMIP